LILNDQIVVERRLERLVKEKGHEREQAVLTKCLAVLSDGRSLRQAGLSSDDDREITSYAFLSLRPVLVVLNVSEADAAKELPAEFLASCADKRLEGISVCASVEAEISSLPKEEQGDFLGSMGIAEPASARLIRAVYHLLDYVSFFTVGEDEVRAWNVYRGDKAPRAAGRVHSDIERGFIRAEVMKYDEFIAVGSEARMKDLGKMHVEGKEYVVQDGDILNFRFNV
jgi:ribosome-binding ATPase YchF (GTP1/OBG family)